MNLLLCAAVFTDLIIAYLSLNLGGVGRNRRGDMLLNHFLNGLCLVVDNLLDVLHIRNNIAAGGRSQGLRDCLGCLAAAIDDDA